MRTVLVVGTGPSGLLLALGLQARGYRVTVMAGRTADEVRHGRIAEAACLFGTALGHERDLGPDFWADQAPAIEGVGLSVAGPGGGRRVDWLGRLPAPARSVDRRMTVADWLETFASRGGRLVLHTVSVAELDHFCRGHDLTLVAAERGELAGMFTRDAARSPFSAPRRAVATTCVHGLEPDAGPFALRCHLMPGLGELCILPALTGSGRCDLLVWEAVPGGPLDAFQDVADPAEHLRIMLELMRRHAPWVHARAGGVELTDAEATRTARPVPSVHRPVAELPSGAVVLGTADVLVRDDPLTFQGANNAAKGAASYLASIVAHGERPFDRAWMSAVFERFRGRSADPATRWTAAMLDPPEHVRELIEAAGRLPRVADRFAGGYDDPADFADWFHRPRAAAAYVAGTDRGR